MSSPDLSNQTKMHAAEVERLAPGPGMHAASALAMKVCLACARERPRSEFVHTSLWPHAIGGEAAPAPFQNGDFCQACQALADVQIDAPFLTSWFMQAELARAAQAFLDPASPGPAPLTYLGIAAEYPVGEGEVCERWAGLAGEAIYHVHPERTDVWAGHSRNSVVLPDTTHAGRAILWLKSPSHYWSTIAVLSFQAHFHRARRSIFTEHPGLQKMASTSLTCTNQPELLPEEILFFKEKPYYSKMVNSYLRLDFSNRFLIKLALGIGSQLLGPTYAATACARQLRRNFWSQTPQMRSFAAAPQGFALPGIWSICLIVQSDILGLAIVTPTGKAFDIVVADSPELWAGEAHQNLKLGKVFFAIPQRNIFTRAFTLDQCQNHCSQRVMHPDLSALQALRVAPRQLPSKQGLA